MKVLKVPIALVLSGPCFIIDVLAGINFYSPVGRSVLGDVWGWALE